MDLNPESFIARNTFLLGQFVNTSILMSTCFQYHAHGMKGEYIILRHLKHDDDLSDIDG